MRLTNPTVLVLLTAVVLAGCTPTGGADPTTVTTTATDLHPILPIDPGVQVISDIQFGEATGEPLLLDVCLPPDAAASGPEV